MTSLCMASVSLFSGALPIVRRRFSRRFAHLDLGAHLLDFRRLFFECCSESCHTLFQFPHFPLLLEESLMLFEKLVEQHRVNRLVTDTVGFTFLIANDQIGINGFHVLGHEPELRDGLCVLLVMKGDRFQREDRVARVIHRSNIVFKASRGRSRTELTVRVNNYLCSSRGELVKDASDIASVSLASNSLYQIADIDVVGTGRCCEPGSRA